MLIYLNINNYLSFYRIFYIFKNPILLMVSLIFKKPPKVIMIRTPIGPLKLHIRNYESLKTIFSIFCRKDYKINKNKAYYLDIGANCGYAAVYFLSRNHENTVTCFEPDPKNIEYLKANLNSFEERAEIKSSGVGSINEEVDLFLSEDGKYNSIIENKKLKTISIKLVSINDILDKSMNINNLIIKIDVEGIETDLIKAINFSKYPNIKKIIVESLKCSKLIKTPHKRKIVNRYIEHISFE